MANALLSSLGPLSRAARDGRVSDEIADRIKSYISEGVVSPGERLPAERELAHKLQTSRLSVREAYRSLEEMGLLSIRRGAGGGAFINEVGHAGVTRSLTTLLRLGRTSHRELTEARMVLEPPLAALAAKHADAEDLAALEALLQKQEAALKGREGPRRLAMEFHRVIAKCAHNRPLEAMMNDHGEAYSGGSNFPARFVTFFFGNGILYDEWIPTLTGPAYELKPQMAPLESVRDYCTVLTGFENKIRPRITHHEGAAGFLSGHPFVSPGGLYSSAG